MGVHYAVVMHRVQNRTKLVLIIFHRSIDCLSSPQPSFQILKTLDTISQMNQHCIPAFAHHWEYLHSRIISNSWVCTALTGVYRYSSLYSLYSYLPLYVLCSQIYTVNFQWPTLTLCLFPSLPSVVTMLIYALPSMLHYLLSSLFLCLLPCSLYYAAWFSMCSLEEIFLQTPGCQELCFIAV